MIHYKHQTIKQHTIEVNTMFHPSELKAMKAAKNNRIKFTYNTKAKIVLLDNAYGVSYPDGRIDRCTNLATAQYLVRSFNR